MNLLGIDLGTSSLRAVLVNEDGRTLAAAGQEYGIDTPKPGWAEQDPHVWWQALRKTISRVVSKHGAGLSKIKSIGFSGQMHGAVLLDRKGELLRPAVIWCDQRSARQCLKIREKIGESGLQQACNRPSTGFMGGTLLWLKENEPGVFRRIGKVLLPKDYLKLRLTGEISTDVSDASATSLFDVRERKWSSRICDALDLPDDMLPPVFESTDIAGRVNRQAARQTGLPAGTVVIAGGADTPVTALGNGVTRPGAVLCSIGTGGLLFTPVERLLFDRKLRTNTFCHCINRTWYIMGAILSGGLSLRWFRDNLGHRDYGRLSAEAEKVSAGSEGLIFLPHLIGERTPHMDPDARGAFVGLTLRHTRAHLVRAIMEGVTFALRDCLEIFKDLGIRIETIVASGGAAASPLWRQMQSDIFQRNVVTVAMKEQAGFGAAALAGIGMGVYKNAEEVNERFIKHSGVTKPIDANMKVYEQYYRIYKQLYPGLKANFSSISKLIKD